MKTINPEITDQPAPVLIGAITGLCPHCGGVATLPITEVELKRAWAGYTVRRRKRTSGWTFKTKPKAKSNSRPRKEKP